MHRNVPDLIIHEVDFECDIHPLPLKVLVAILLFLILVLRAGIRFPIIDSLQVTPTSLPTIFPLPDKWYPIIT